MQRLTALTALIAIAAPAAAAPKHPVDRSGKTQTGVASYYGPHHAGKTTASGEPMRPNHLTAASPSLPLGTRARVTNRQTGKSVHVTVTDRGPYAKGRIIDVSSKAAETLGMKHDGVAPVNVKPVEAPPPKP
jgi:rare lipoprotein A